MSQTVGDFVVERLHAEGQPLDPRSVRDIGSATDGVGHELCLVTGL